MMFMVPVEADFTLRASVQPTPKPVVKMNYMNLDYNGYHYESDYDVLGETSYYRYASFGSNVNNAKYAMTNFSFGGTAPFSLITFWWPSTAHAGDTFTVTKANGEGTINNATRKDCYVSLYLDDNRLLYGGKFYSLNYTVSSASDYFTLTITKAEETEYGYLMEGAFEGVIASMSTTRKAEIKNGFFSVYVK